MTSLEARLQAARAPAPSVSRLSVPGIIEQRQYPFAPHASKIPAERGRHQLLPSLVAASTARACVSGFPTFISVVLRPFEGVVSGFGPRHQAGHKPVT